MDRISKEQRSKIMSSIRSENTKPEITLRKALWSAGLRFKVHYCEEKIDIAFPSRRLAIFVDGCFWHGCPQHYRAPKTHKGYWRPKIERNIKRDKAKDERLKAGGWRVMRFWEHELKDVEKVSKKIQRALTKGRREKKNYLLEISLEERIPNAKI